MKLGVSSCIIRMLDSRLLDKCQQTDIIICLVFAEECPWAYEPWHSLLPATLRVHSKDLSLAAPHQVEQLGARHSGTHQRRGGPGGE